MCEFTPPTTRYPWPTGDRLTSRLNIDRGISVVTDGMGGWTTTEYPWSGDIQDLIEGTDYFLGGHFYPEVEEFVANSLRDAGFTVFCNGSEFLYPALDLYPALNLYPMEVV